MTQFETWPVRFQTSPSCVWDGKSRSIVGVDHVAAVVCQTGGAVLGARAEGAVLGARAEGAVLGARAEGAVLGARVVGEMMEEVRVRTREQGCGVERPSTTF